MPKKRDGVGSALIEFKCGFGKTRDDQVQASLKSWQRKDILEQHPNIMNDWRPVWNVLQFF